MKKVFIWMALGAWLAGMGLAGCGQTGPLYLPKSTQPSSATSTVTKKAEKVQSSSSASSLNNPNPIAQPTAFLAPPTKPLVPTASSSKSSH